MPNGLFELKNMVHTGEAFKDDNMKCGWDEYNSEGKKWSVLSFLGLSNKIEL